MKQLHHIIAILLMACLVSACSDSSYPGIEYQYPPSPEVNNGESGDGSDLGLPVRVLVSNNSFISTTTKGMGPFDEDMKNRYEKSRFYLFAFRDRPDDQGPLTYEPRLTYTSTDATDTKANCLIDGYDYNFGMPTHLKTGEFKMLNHNLTSDTTLTYSKRYTDIGYNFFAYHLDDDSVVQSVQRQDQRIVYDLKIDGTQDIMVGYAPRLTPQVLTTRYMGVALTEEQRNKVLNIGNYSSYASALGINPIVNMNHLLTRLRITAYPALPTCNGLKITSVTLRAHNQLRFTVAASDLNEVESGVSVHGEPTTLHLCQQQKTTDPTKVGFLPVVPFNPEDHIMKWNDSDASKDLYSRTPLVLGCDMMVPRDTTYLLTIGFEMEIKSTADAVDTYTHKFSSTFVLNARDLLGSLVDYEIGTDTYWFRRGQIYNVRLGIYGLDGAELGDVTADPWIDGGDIYDEETLQEHDY